MKQIILLLVCFNSFLIKAQTQYKSFHFSTDDGLPSNTIYSITQDNNKNLILGTDNGLSVFNGNEFVNYNVKDGLTNPYIVSVCQEGSVIFLINYNGNIQKFQNKKITTTPIFTDYYNQISIYRDSIYLYSIQNRNLNSTYNYTRVNKVSLKATKNYTTSVFSSIAAPILLQNRVEIKIINQFLNYKNFRIKLPKEINFIHKVIFRKNDICILEDSFLYMMNLNGQIKFKIKLPENLSKNINFKYDFVVDDLENCWLSIQNKGLFILKNNCWNSLSESIGLNKQDNINFLYCDHTGKLWIATNEKGLYCIPTTLNETIAFKNSDNYFNGLATATDQNSLFFSSKFKLYLYKKDGQIKFLDNSNLEISLNNYNKVPILSTVQIPSNFWNEKFNLFTIKGKQVIEKRDESTFISLSGNNSISISKIENGKTITNDVVNKFKTKEKIKSIIKFKGEFYFNNGKEIDIRTFDDKFIYCKRKLKFKINGFIEDFAFVKDTMWVAANNSIYKVYNERVIDSIIKINTVKLVNVRKIKQIENTVFLCAGNGLFKISNNNNFVFNKFNFLPGNDVLNVTAFGNNLFIATNSGLAKVNQQIFSRNSNCPTFQITANEKIVSKLSLNSNQMFASIKLNIQNFNSLENQIVQYMVDSSNWIETRNNSINFQLVSYGNHKIVIRVRDVNSNWEIKNFEIYRAYPFYLKWWFFVLSVLFTVTVLGFIFRYQIKKINIKKAQEIAISNQIIELRQNALSAMMNPHFIFNSLSASQYFINSNQQEKSSEHIGKLARLVRLFLSQSSQSFISIADEIKRLQLYVELEQVRFNNFKFELNVDEKINILEAKIPNMIVQPFIENAILHGISNPKITDGKIELKFALKNDIIIIEIIDNGFGIDENKTKNNNHISKGIAIIEERLSILQYSNPTKVFSITQDFAFINLERKGHRVVIKTTIFN